MKSPVTYRTAGGRTVTWTKNTAYTHDFGPWECDGCGHSRSHSAPENAQAHARKCTAY